MVEIINNNNNTYLIQNEFQSQVDQQYKIALEDLDTYAPVQWIEVSLKTNIQFLSKLLLSESEFYPPILNNFW